MLLTYAFALGATRPAVRQVLGADGLDWKVPYFLFVLLVAVGVDYNVFLMTRLQEEAAALGLRAGINRAIAQTGGLISSAAAITASQLRLVPVQPARLAATARVRSGGRHHGRRRPRPPPARALRPLADEPPPRAQRVLPVPTPPIGHLAHVAD